MEMPGRKYSGLSFRQDIQKSVALFAGLAALFMFVLWFSPVRMDEVWCFAFSNRVLDGWLPYRDFGAVIPPLFIWLGAPFAKSLMLFRVFGALISAGIVLAAYWICRLGHLGGREAGFRTAGVFVLLAWFPDANYNLLLVLCLLLAYLSGRRLLGSPSPANAWATGVFLTLACLSKQNVGGIALLVVIIYLGTLVRKGSLPGVAWLRVLGGAAAPAALTLIYFMATGTGGVFLDFGLFGLGDFSGNLAFQAEGAPFILLAAILLTGMAWNLAIAPEARLQTGLALCIGASGFLLAYPIVDGYHALVLCILLCGMLPGFSRNGGHKRLWPAAVGITVLLILAGTRGLMLASAPGESVRLDLPPYQGILFPSELAEEVRAVSGFIREREAEGYDVAVMSPVAYLYILPSGDYNSILDLPARGNTGGRRLEELLEEASGKNILLVRDHAHWQDVPGLHGALLDAYQPEDVIGDYWILRIH